MEPTKPNSTEATDPQPTIEKIDRAPETPPPILLPKIATFVLFRVHKGEPDKLDPSKPVKIIDRPLLILGYGAEPGTLNGVLFLQGEDDRSCHWPSLHMMFLPGQVNTLILRDKKRGDEEGEWHED